jgi:DnaJ homolog subfamily B member 12
LIVASAHPLRAGQQSGALVGGIWAMNADEAQKCLLVAQRLLAQANTADVEAANAALERATKYAEKGKRLDADGAGPLADELLGRIAARKRALGSNGASSQNAAPGGSGGRSARASAPDDRRTNHHQGGGRRASNDAEKTPKPQRGTPEQEALLSKIRASNGDYYSILGVARSASDADVKKAYRKLALKLHPDKCQANGAEEAFKSVSKAFACLSDKDKRAAYDRYGTEDPSSLSSGRGGGGAASAYRRRHGGGTYYTEEEVDPAEIFNMFFGGGFGGPGVRFHAGGSGGFRSAQFARAQFAREQEARRARARGGGAAGTRASNDPDPAELFRGLFQLLPLLLVFLLYFLSPGGEEHFALSRTPTFRHEMRTERLDQPFYVKDLDAFEEAYPSATRQRLRAESNIEASHINAMEHNCLYERQQQQRLFRYGNKAERERANAMTLNSCVKLQNVRKKQNALHANHQRGTLG